MMKLTEIQHGEILWQKREKEKILVQSAERIFQVMETLADHGEMGLMELSTALDLHKSTVHRLLMSLIYMDTQSRMRRRRNICFPIRWSTWRERSLSGWIFCRWQSRIWNVSRTCPGKRCIWCSNSEGNHILYIYKIEAKVGTIRMVSHVGMVHPMYCSGVGKAIMATLPDEEVKRSGTRVSLRKRRTRRSRISRRCRKY